MPEISVFIVLYFAHKIACREISVVCVILNVLLSLNRWEEEMKKGEFGNVMQEPFLLIATPGCCSALSEDRDLYLSWV